MSWLSSILKKFVLSLAVLCISQSVDASAGTASIETQIVKILTQEASHGQIKAGILDFKYSLLDQNERLSKEQLRALEAGLTEKLTSSLIQEIKKEGAESSISIIERERLDVILREKQLQVTGLTERTASAIGGLAGLDVILLGTARGYRDPSSISIKAIRVKDGEILGIAEQTIGKITLIDTVTDLHAHSFNALPLTLQQSGTLTIMVTVERGNPINISLMASSEYEKFKKEKKHKQHIDFEAKKTKQYIRSIYLPEGEYFLVFHDKTLGVVSERSSDIKVTAYLEP